MTARQRTRDMFVYVVGIVVVVGIVASFFLTRSEVNDVGSRVTKVESPCLRYGPDSKICEEAFETAALSINHRMACFFQHRAGVHPPSCRGVHLRIEKKPPLGRGGGSSIASTGAPSSQTTSQEAGPGQPQEGGGAGPPPGKGGSGGGKGPGKGGSGGAPVPGSGGNSGGEGEAPVNQPSGSGGPPQGVTETSPEPSPGSSVGTLPETVKSLGGAAGEVVGKASEGVGGIVKGADETLGDVGCKLVGRC